MKNMPPPLPFLVTLVFFTVGIFAQNPESKEKKKEDLKSYLEEYRITTLDFEKKDLYNYYLDVFLRVAKEKKTFEKDIKIALRYFNRAPNLKPKERIDIGKIVFYSQETQEQTKERVSAFYDAFAETIEGFSEMMTRETYFHLDKLELKKINYVISKGIFAKNIEKTKDERLLVLYFRILISRGQYKASYELLKKVRESIRSKTYRTLQIEALLYEGDIKLAKTLLQSNEADFDCKQKPTNRYDFNKRRLVSIFYRIAGDFKKSLDCLKPLEENNEMEFFYYYDGMKASRLLDKDTTNYLFKKAAQLANRKASKYLNILLDWEEVKNKYFQERLNNRGINEVIDTLRVQSFRPSMVAADNLQQNLVDKGEELIKHPKLKYLELLDIYWLVTLKKIELKRRNKKK